ncbi:Gfo/Idh/MocA family protein [Aestuariimicrobium sp. T2.26MG-19.2B]|uniref:Gfo/Idh/MocA family protein n=1 Tax=Aestuariimicrobium sp. T2.26MG-19.2B TaxID=3040679 RepID=UPI0024772F83|nr:Gfo/Idh/MocA family oxidoreductase [Aestuariimicrobium sp. T2.26MG-19.2B]CAI9411380.1 Putative UDP-kanosamine synthase oxidoreductase subunit [Aestuariimicrobium sp. T2.26MG-19.2B]
MTAKVRVGIVGTGGIARARHLPCLTENESAELVALCDIKPDVLKKAGDDFDVAARYTDYLEMYDNENLDAVVVCTPNDVHAPATIAALERGINVLCEKPMALDPTEGEAMLAAAEKSGKLLTFGFHYRHMPEVMAARRVVDSGELGDVYMVRVQALRRRGIPSWGTFVHKHIQGGGAMIDFGVHLLDSALWLMGNPKAIEVTASLSQRLGKSPNVNTWGDWNYQEFTVEDQVAAFVRFENGVTMMLECSWAINIPESRENISLSGTRAGLEVFPLSVNKADHEMLTTWKPDWIADAKLDPGAHQAAEFVNAVRTGGTVVTKPSQALQVTRIVDAMYRSAESGEAVKL